MGVTVREAMQIGGLVLCKVVAGEEGLDRRLESVAVMEVPDVIRWLKRNVLLLTSLYPIKDDEAAIRQLVQQLEAAGSSALAIKPEPYLKEIPDIIKKEGDRLHFPIIEVQPDVSYLDIMTPLMELILGEMDTGKEQLELFLQWITELTMRGKGLPALIDAIEQMTGKTVTVGSDFPELERSKGMHYPPLTHAQKAELKLAKRPVHMHRLLKNRPTACIVTPILLNDELCGDVTCWSVEQEITERDYQVLHRTMMLMALEFLKMITQSDVEQTYKDHLVSDIVLGRIQDQAATIEKGTLFGWDLTKSFEVLCIAADDKVEWSPEQKRRVLQQVHAFFRFEPFKEIVTFLKERFVVLLPRDNDTDRQDEDKVLAQLLRQHLQHGMAERSFTIGIGRWYPGLEGIHQGYVEAVRAVELGKPVAREGCVHYGDLGLFRLLGQVHDREELERFYAETVGRLAEYDAMHQSGLVTTLEHYFANHGSLSDIADKLFIHVNTMKYRLQKIEQITKCKVNDSEHRMLLHVGLKIYQMMKSEHNG